MHSTRQGPGRAELALLALWLLSTIALRPLLLPDEGRYAGVAFEMLHGSAVLPTLDGLPYFHKPPLLYWAELLAMSLFGVNAFAVRLGPALFGWCLGAALFLHVRRWHGLASARCALAVLATSPLFFFGAQYVNHDIGVAAFITAGVLAFVRAVDDDGPVVRRWVLAGWAACGLAVLAKGLIGIVLPALVVAPWLLAQGRWRALLGLLHPLGLLVFVGVALPWMLAMQAQYPGFFDYFIVEQHFRRFAGLEFNNVRPIWFFWLVLPLTMLPWSLWWLRRPATGGFDARRGLYLWWLLVIVGFFSLPASKLIGYVMPALAPASALLAMAIGARAGRWPVWAATAGAFCLLAVIGLAWKGPVGNADIALALAERWQPGDRLVFIESHPFDLRLLAGITTAAIVVSDWADPELPRRDNWRKEMFDAARFASDGGQSVLWRWDRVAEIACHPGHTWVVSPPGDKDPRLELQPVLKGRHADLGSAAAASCRPAGARP